MPSNTLEWILLVLGCAIGVFYGFDGWRGSLENVELKDSPRVKNFIWAVVTAFGIFIADFKTIDASVQKPRLLLLYLVGFLLLSTIVVLFWAAAIAVKFTYTRFFEADNYPLPPFTPVADYLRYGYEYYSKRYEAALERSRVNEVEQCRRDSQKKANEFEQYRLEVEPELEHLRELKNELEQVRHHTDSFLPAYIEQVALAIAAVDHYRSRPDDATKSFVARQILQSIRAVVLEYYGEVDGLLVNANYMIAYHKSSPPKDWSSRLRFGWEPVSRYEYFLALEEYAFDVGRENFVLPVESKSDPRYMDRVLPGAPHAFVTNMPVVVDDIRQIVYPSGVEAKVADDIREYFHLKWTDFKSFACLNIVGQGNQLGIVHVESNMESVFGSSEEKKQQIMSLLQPFCLLLGFVIRP